MLQRHKSLHVVSLHLEHGFVLVICQCQTVVLMLAHLLLQEDIKVSCLHEGKAEVNWQDDVHHVYLLDHYAVGLKDLF